MKAGIQKVRTVINMRLNQNIEATINQGPEYHVMVFALYPNSNGKLVEGFLHDYKDYSGMEEAIRASKVLIMFYFLTRVLVT